MSTKAELPSQRIALQRGSDAFYAGFVRSGALTIGSVFLLVVVMGAAFRDMVGVAAGAFGVLMGAGVYALTYRGNGMLGRRLFVYWVIGGSGFGALLAPADTLRFTTHVAIAGLALTFAGFLLPRVDLLINLVLAFAILAGAVVKQTLAEGWNPQLVATCVTVLALVAVQAIAVSRFTTHARSSQAKLHTYVDEVDRVMAHADRIAKGDLAGTVEGESDVSSTIRAMLDGLRALVSQSRDAASALSSSAQEIASMARQQEQGAVEQASAVGQVHETLGVLLTGSNEAARSTEAVFRNVELTQRTSELVAQRAAALSSHTRRISALLEIIKAIANKSEILALNAALEGARAGEAGRGFSLVASQMQRLAESVMDSVRDVRALVEDIDAASAATLAATEESTRLSAEATTAARQISATLQQQRRSTEQVAAAMQDIRQVTAQVSASSVQSLSATHDLTRLAGELKSAIERFQV